MPVPGAAFLFGCALAGHPMQLRSLTRATCEEQRCSQTAHDTARCLSGVLTMNDGRFANPSRAFAAQYVTIRSTLVVRATEISPSAMNCAATSADGLMNCGINARKNAAVLGLNASTTMLSRKARRAPVV